ncbi:ArsR/SmtB family transcription factor [Sedimentitalea todarodis]|uniref:Winged helix-turn-helix domain-containing protein n=1 Tax=Sedimentitalea todarodis TaxID=1631240 RepID=A0ABU3VAG8_9RHOB|nr:winged helix-turn-helix domain-containing protein [Sedimentitalea todarodis]MDU9003073.1 winged helix-turn-helix domain-containing protein [Sedimentitalea todarodis]
MREGPDFTAIASLIGDPARANMLTALMSGKALTAGELAVEAGVSAQTASSHLHKLQDAGLLKLQKQGRHRYYSLSGDNVAQTLEALMGLAAGLGHMRTRTGPRDQALRTARVCYNHLAGDLGVQMFSAMRRQGHFEFCDTGLDLSEAGQRFVAALGISAQAMPRSKAPMCRECLDWSVRQSHLAGRLGRAMLARFETLGWARRVPDTRIVQFSDRGLSEFNALF